MPHRFQGGEIVFRLHLLGQARNPSHHGRHQIDPGGLVAGNFAQGGLGVEFRHQDHTCPDMKGGKDGDDGPVVIKRPRHQHDVVGRNAPQFACQPVHHARLPRHDQLGPPGRSAGGGRLPRRRNAVGQVAVVVRPGQKGVRRNHGFAGIHRQLADHDGRFRQFDNGANFGLRQARRNRLRHRTNFPAGVKGFDEADAVGQRDGDVIPEFRASCLKPARHAVGPAVQFAPGPALRAALHRNAVRLARRFPGQGRANGNKFFADFRFAHL